MDTIDPLTTGQAANYCHVSQATIVNWIKKGELKAYATPGGHYRILPADFLSFLEEYGMPVHSALASRPRLLVLADDPVAAQLGQALGRDGRFDVLWAQSEFEAGALVERFRPDGVLMDVAHTMPGCAAFCKWLRGIEKGRRVFVLAVGSPGQRKAALASGADSFLAQGTAADGLLRELEALRNAR
ncbi:MAG: helix-turn-helix domain-containing protein [Anaerolineales bacterium]|nr:MAG: helix-turn-helix domain-containing protein [Anaerolineales bacterium]